MDANKIRVVFDNRAKDIVLPLEQIWDFSGNQEAIEQYETTVIEQILNKGDDFEVTRFDHNVYDTSKTSINYEFYFNQSNLNTPAWINSYLPKFSTEEVYYYTNPFTRSFWKLDLYDSPSTRTQKAYVTIILPVQQGFLANAVLNNTTAVKIKKPKYSLDYIGDKEGFFIYWLKKRNFLNINEFYMTAKFFDANTGRFIKMMKTKQSELSSPTGFPPEEYFYYKVNLDYVTQTYEVYDFPNGSRVGTVTNPIKWYEYINP